MKSVAVAVALAFVVISLTAVVLVTASQDGSSSTTDVDGEILLVQSAVDRSLNDSLYWGTYRPNVINLKPTTLEALRNFCEMGDQLDSMDYLYNDGRRFAEQLVEDPAMGVALRYQFVKRPTATDRRGEWSVRLTGERFGQQERDISLLVYSLTQDPSGSIGGSDRRDNKQQTAVTVDGQTTELGPFQLTINVVENGGDDAFTATDQFSPQSATITDRLTEEQSFRLKEMVQVTLKSRIEEILRADPEVANHPPPPQQLFMLSDFRDPSTAHQEPNFHLHQLRVKTPFKLEVHFHYTFNGAADNGKNDDDKNYDGKDDDDDDYTNNDEQEAKDEANLRKDSNRPESNENNMDQLIEQQKTQFNMQFEKRFPLTAPFDASAHSSDEYRRFARVLLSNLVGGIGYYHGNAIVDQSSMPTSMDKAESFLFSHEDDELESLLMDSLPTGPSTTDDLVNDDVAVKDIKRTAIPTAPPVKPVEVGPFQLFTGSPSRSFFPRGFLWDEGFHQSALMHWDPQLSLSILRSWLALVDENGWVAREQILGPEARSRVPPEFQVQFQNYANPPTLVLPLLSLIRALGGGGEFEENELFLNNREELHETILQLQTSDSEQLATNAYSSSARQLLKLSVKQLFPTLERHFQWMRRSQSAGSLPAPLRSVAGRELFRWQGRTATHCLTSGMDDYPRAVLEDDDNQVEFHGDLQSWMAFYAQSLATIGEAVGVPEDSVANYRNLSAQFRRDLNDLFWDVERRAFGDLIFDYSTGRSERIVHYGYLSLLPLFLGQVPANDSDKLKSIFDLMENPKHLWSDYGLRSLSASDPMFGKGENYWRGPIWINMNYLALRSLHLYYNAESSLMLTGDLAVQAGRIYQQLRQNVVENVYAEHRRTGFLWEQYNSTSGKGQRSHPFSGWTALVLNLMAEKY